jgi:hypothetical protein
VTGHEACLGLRTSKRQLLRLAAALKEKKEVLQCHV